MAIGAGMTSAIMNPLHAEAKSAVLAADVLMGTDENCADLDPRQPRPERARRRGRSRRSRGPSAAKGLTGATVRRASDRLHAVRSERNGRARHHRARCGAPARRRPRHGVRWPRHLRSLPGRARRGQLRQVGDHRRSGRARAAGVDRDRLPRQPSARRRSPPRVRGARSAATSSSTSRRPARSTGRSCARTSTSRRSRSTRRSRCWYVEVPKLELGQPGDDLTSRRRDRPGGCSSSTAVPSRRSPFGVLAALQPALDRGRRRDHVAVDEADRLVAIWPGYVDAAFGVAVDIGSTTIAGHLCDLTTGEVLASAGRMNPQIRFGEDLMSRVSYVMMNPGGDRQLTEAVRGALDELIGELLERRRPCPRPCARGGPGRQPDHAPHRARHRPDPARAGAVHAGHQPRRRHAGDRSLDLALPNARVYVGPCIAGHVGADTAGAILAEGPHRSEHMQLLVDVGTNAEIVLGDRDRQFAASSPTGPAFEGRADQLRSAGHGGRDRGRAHRSGHARAAAQGDRCRRLVGRSRVRRQGRPHRRHRHLRVRASSTSSPRCTSPE